MTGSRPDDDELAGYLLGLLPEDDAERIDELSIADDEVAWRIREVENDLVDAYVSGALSGDILEHFRSFYLSSPLRREKVRCAQSFVHAAETRSAEARPAEARPSWPAEARPATVNTTTRRSTVWMLAAAATLLLVVGGTLLFQNLQLRHALERAQSARASRQAAPGPPASSPPLTPSGLPAPASSTLAPATLVLLSPARAAGSLAIMTVPSRADRVSVELQLDSDDFPQYQAALRDLAADRIIWRSGVLAAGSAGDMPAVSFTVPAGTFEAWHYAFELTGRGAGGRAEIIGIYPFRIARP